MNLYSKVIVPGLLSSKQDPSFVKLGKYYGTYK